MKFKIKSLNLNLQQIISLLINHKTVSKVKENTLPLTVHAVFFLPWKNILKENDEALAWTLRFVILCSSARIWRKHMCCEVSWNLLELTSAASLTLLILLTHGSARLESPPALLTLTLLSSRHPAADDNFLCTLPKGSTSSIKPTHL